MPRAGVFWKQYREVQSGLLPCPPARCRCRPYLRLPPTVTARQCWLPAPSPCQFPSRLAPWGAAPRRTVATSSRDTDCQKASVYCRPVSSASYAATPAEPKSHVVADPPLPAQPGLEWRREQERGGSQYDTGRSQHSDFVSRNVSFRATDNQESADPSKLGTTSPVFLQFPARPEGPAPELSRIAAASGLPLSPCCGAKWRELRAASLTALIADIGDLKKQNLANRTC
ncbi:bcl-2-modifying factor isoform X2 [Desmodus rotundus]|uniref:bcl-2-modifying factor isoform X2 n=1 Tax=Desmodus rotundus TaxID=9430 RepID=UPI002380F0A9|nr:bcl-2-modifying factor isoform X2 [Desmodus rotundus]